ncbi:hypothetical protein, partial [Vibrio parahaemolyticus]|uniref:hypothetical protein n=1 Tax=Vibrio parahaemolyticus TaxID=670 RepID=UPI0021110051
GCKKPPKKRDCVNLRKILTEECGYTKQNLGNFIQLQIKKIFIVFTFIYLLFALTIFVIIAEITYPSYTIIVIKSIRRVAL